MRLLMIPLCLLVLCGACLAEPPAEEQVFERLFDGKSFAGWEGDRQTFRIEHGAIVGGSLKQRVPRNEFLCTEQEFGDFELRLSAKLVGSGGNAGIQIRSERVPNHHEMIGYQADMGAMGQRNIWGSLYDESRRRRFLAEGDSERLNSVIKRDGWNEFVIRCEGRRIQIWVNGLQTTDYKEADEQIPQSGLIGLQIHGGPPAEAWYRDIRIKPL